MMLRQLCIGTLFAVLFLPAAMGATTTAPSAAPILIPTADFPRPDHPEMGINLEDPSNTARSMMYVDAMKSAGGIGSLKKADDKTPSKMGAKPPGKGAPKAEKPAEKPATPVDLGVDVILDTPVPPGDYLFFCKGNCHVEAISEKASVTQQEYIPLTNTTTATINVEAGAAQLSLSFTGVKGGTQLSDIRLLRPGYPAGTDQIFTKEFLAALKPYSVIRLNAIPLPIGIRLANQVGKDIWINISPSASDDAVKAIAHLTFDKLARDRNIYIECSSEISAPQMPAAQPATAPAQAANPSITAGGDWQQTASRTVQISNFFRSAWGARTINSRVRVMLASPSANSQVMRNEIEYIEKTYGAPAKFIYGVAEAPYISIDEKANIDDSLTPDRIFKLLNGSMKDVQDSTLQFQTLARYYRLHHLAYAGGPALLGEHASDAKNQASRDARMTPLIADYLTRWYAVGGELFMYYNLASPYGKYSSWGLTETIDVPSVKNMAMDKVLAVPTPVETSGTAVPGVISAALFNACNRDITVEANKPADKPLISLRGDNWFDYLLNVKEPGKYRLSFQTASMHGGEIDALMCDQPIGSVQCPVTGNWQKWASTDAIHLQLEKGQIVLRVKIVKPGMNIRSITFEKEAPPAH